MHPEDRQRVIDVMHTHKEHDIKYEVEYRLIANGDTRWVRSAGQVERNADGKLAIMRGIVQDITERKNSQERRQTMRNFVPIWTTFPTSSG